MAMKTLWDADESYRKAALFLARLPADGQPPSVMFCSSRHGEGTTTAVLTLARHLQENHGMRPLVVELDRWKPALVKLLKLEPDRTLRAAMSGERPPADCIQLSSTGIPILAGARRRPAESGVGLERGLKQVLDEVAGDFDILLIDAPPLLSEADAFIAGSVVPLVILVVEAGRTSREVAERVKRDLAQENITIVATILNKQRRFIPGPIYRALSH